MDAANDKMYHFVNFQCKLDCGERYYPDESDPNFYFCRNCPSNCLNCDNARTCTACIKDYYLTTLNGYKLCVRAKDCAAGSFPTTKPDASGSPQQICDNCLSNCKKCNNSGDCSECFDGYFLDISNLPPAPPPAPLLQYKCDLTCPQGKFALPSGLCANCKSNCEVCKDTLTCEKCNPGYSLIEDKSECQLPIGGKVCPDGYYYNATTLRCQKCPPECFTCNTGTFCTACILGHFLDSKLGNCL